MPKKITERACVNRLVKAIQKNSPGVYIHIDRDSGSTRHTSSGWDFLIAYKDEVTFYEAKMEKGQLTTWQKFTKATIENASCLYSIVRFSTDGELFSVDGGAWEKIDGAKIY